MKRIRSACLNQTIHFQLKEPLPRETAERITRQEYAGYKSQLERRHTQYKILEELPQPDGSLIVRIKKQVTGYPVGDYLD